VTDYLLKPISFARFLQAIEKVKVKEDEKDFSFSVKADGKTYRIEVDSICYVESKGDYIVIHQEDDKVMVYMTMKKILELCRNRLCRIHKSYAVAVPHVRFVEGNVAMVGDKEIPIGASYKEDFMRRMGISGNK
jgi:DNA-binding LytR/AlgR family response regulator